MENVVATAKAGVLGDAVRSGSPIGRAGRGPMWATPLTVKGSVVGSLGIGGYDVSQTDCERIEDLVAVTVLGLEHMGERNAAARSVTEIATVLSSLIESRDTYTERHCVALAEMSVGVGIRMGLGSEQLTVLNLAGHLHDIGKVSIPDEVLLKEGPLTETESAVMKSHTVIGERVLSKISSFADVAPVVGQHHERFDGTGYPWGLRGDGILLEARILAVVDAFDAMTTTRPYRAALPVEVAVQEIRDGAGSQFDPEVAGMFLVYLQGEEAQWNPRRSR
jgi:HD-GYP domain-containing protein (c-di-GMP phosphodiesterase class II)